MDSATKLQNKLDKWEQKSDRYKAYISRLEMKSQAHQDKQDKPLKSYTVVIYSDNDKATSESQVHFRLDTSVTTKSQYEKNKPRGILHKLDEHIKTENIGFVVPVITKDDTAPITKRISVSLHNKALPEIIQDSASYTKRTLLATENAVIKVGDSFKHMAQPVAKAASSVLKMKAYNQIYRSAQENTGLKAGVGITTAAVSTGRMIHRWSSNKRQYMAATKGLKLEQRTAFMKALSERLEMKSSVAQERHIYKELRKITKENGLDLKFSRAEKKKAWKKVFDNNNKQFMGKPELNLKTQRDTFNSEKKEFKAEKKEYLKSKNENNVGALKASEDKFKASKEKYNNAKDSFKAEKKKAKKINRLESKELNEAKKVYNTKLVKETYFNTATGRTQTKYHRVIDKSHKKVQKPKRPDSLFISASKMGLGALGNKMTAELANSDDVGTQALGRGLQFGMSELSNASQKKAMQSKLKFDKKIQKSQMKMEKAHNQLQIEKSGSDKPKPKKKDKKAMKKSAAKKRNAKQFKEDLKKKAKALNDKAVAKAKEFAKKKMLPAIIGAGGGIAIILLVMMLPIMLLGGNTNTSAVIGVATYTNDREGLMEFNAAYNKLMWEWQKGINEKMSDLKENDTSEWEWVLNPCSGGPIISCDHIEGGPYVEDAGNVYEVVKTLYGGENCGFSSYDITCLYAYFTVKYRDEDWASVSDEMGSFFNENFELAIPVGGAAEDTKKTVTLGEHITMDCEEVKNPPATDDKGNPVDTGSHFEHHVLSTEPHEVDVSKKVTYYYLFKKEGGYNTVQEYIQEKVKEIGEVGGNDDEVNDYGIKVNEDGKTVGELHYELLLKSLGLHQVIDFPLLDENGEQIDWSEIGGKADGRTYGKLTELYNKNEGLTNEVTGAPLPPDYAYRQKEEDLNYVNIPYAGGKVECVAGGDGVIKSKSSTSISIEYTDDNLIITYTCTSVDDFGNILGGSSRDMTTLSVGSAVETGTHLFYSEANDGNSPSVKITAHDTKLDKDINPLLVIQSKVNT